MACSPQRKITVYSILFLALAVQRGSRKNSLRAARNPTTYDTPYAHRHSFLSQQHQASLKHLLVGVLSNMLGWLDKTVSSNMGLLSPATQHAEDPILVTRRFTQ